MTTLLPTETTTTWALAQRSRIRAFRVGRYLLVVAEGDLPTPGWEIDIVQSPVMSWPSQFNLLRRQRPGTWPRDLVPYRHGEVVSYPEDPPNVTVHHVDGEDVVTIEECGEDLADFAALVADGTGEAAGRPAGVEATGLSRRLSFDEAFADALAKLPPSIPARPNALTRVQVVDIGGLFGGTTGFHHLAVRVRRCD